MRDWRGRKKKKEQRILRCVVKNECEFSHTPDDGKGCCFFCQVEGKQKSVCILFLCKEVEAMCCGDGRCSYHKLLCEPIRKTVHFPSCFVAL